eukprot:1152083-Pelagomonas_calceolata.AAC.9
MFPFLPTMLPTSPFLKWRPRLSSRRSNGQPSKRWHITSAQQGVGGGGCIPAILDKTTTVCTTCSAKSFEPEIRPAWMVLSRLQGCCDG